MRTRKALNQFYALLLSKPQSAVLLLTTLMTLSPLASAQQQNLVQSNEVHGINQKYITYGFEAEFRGPHSEKFVRIKPPRPDDPPAEPVYLARTENYPFLDFEADTESSQNYEIRSLGGERKLSETLEQMQLVKSDLQGDLKGFHMHIRVPKEMIQQHNELELKSWIHYLGDIVFAWRVETKNSFLSLRSSTLSRKTAFNVTDKGPVRLDIKSNGDWDFEIRGYMGNITKIEEMARVFTTGILNPTLVRKDAYAQIARSLSEERVSFQLEKYLNDHFREPLEYDQMALLRKVENEVTHRGLLPIYDFKSLSGLEPTEIASFEKANEVFLEDVYALALRIEQMKDFREQSNAFNNLVKKWASSTQLHRLLLENVYSNPKDIPAIKAKEAEILKKFQEETQSPISRVEDAATLVVMMEKNEFAHNLARTIIQKNYLGNTMTSAINYLGNFKHEDSYDLLRTKLDALLRSMADNMDLKSARRSTIKALFKTDFADKYQLFAKLYQDGIETGTLVETLENQSPEFADQVINEILMKETNLRKLQTAIESMRNLKSASSLKLFQQAAALDGSFFLHKEALIRLSNFKDQKSIDLVLKSARLPDHQIVAAEALYKMVGSTKAKLLLARIPDNADFERTRIQSAKRDLLNKKGTLSIKSPSNIRFSCEKLF